MDNKTLGIIGGVALLIALLSPFFMENSKKVEKLYKEAETLRQSNKYMNAVQKYTAVLNESKKLGNTPIDIDSDFPEVHIPILTNYRIALCYYEHGKDLNNSAKYTKASVYIDEIINKTSDNKLRGNLIYLQSMILYRTGKSEKAFTKLIDLEKYYSRFDRDVQWIPEVLFTIGDIYLQQAENLQNQAKEKKCAKAKNYFQKVIDNYQDTEYYSLAVKGINKIKQICPEKVLPPPIPDPFPLPIDEKKAKNLLDQADNYRNEREFIKAMEQYNKLIKLYPNSQFLTNAYEGKGDIYSEEGNYIQALDNYEKAIYSSEDLERRGMLYIKYQSEFPLPNPILPEPDPVLARYHKAIKNIENGQYIEAAKILEEILKDSKDLYYISLYFRMVCDCYYRAYVIDNVQFQESINRLRELGDKYKGEPFSIEAFQHIVQIYQKENNFDYVRNTINSVQRHYSRIEDETIRNVLDSWKKYLENNVDGGDIIDPIPPSPIEPNEVSLFKEGQKLFNKNRLEEAYKKVEAALSNNKDYSPAIGLKNSILNKHLEYGINYFKNKEYQKAIVQFQTIIKNDQTFAKAHCNLGITYIRLDRFESAIESLKDAIDINSEFKEAHNYLGFAYYKLKIYPEALKAVEKALEIDPNYDAAMTLKRAIENQSVKSD